MVDFKLVIGQQDGKTLQKEFKGELADNLLKRRLGETIKGDVIGFAGYEFLLTGGSDKSGFPMRKGIQEPRKRIMIGKGVGFCGKKRSFGKKKVRKTQKGLLRRRTVCGEMVTKIIRQINLKVVKAGSEPLETPETSAETASDEEKKQ